MIRFDRFTLDNGLRVIVHNDPASNIVAINTLYDVGARDEDPEKTGFAHLFEHLMFGGSVNIPDFDGPLQRVGGDSNAYTTNDVTNYYITVPRSNIETGFWLESDRMMSLAFSERSLEVQRSVVIEEFKQRYLNQPYGDVWFLMRDLMYKVHPYRWATIGKEIAHIEDATLDDVRNFFYKHYRSNKAILVVVGNVTIEEVKRLAEKWYGPIPAGDAPKRNLPQEPKQTEARMLEVHRPVPVTGFFETYHMMERGHERYPATDLISDVLSRGKSSRLHAELVKNRRLFSEIGAYVAGSLDPGYLVVTGKLANGANMEEAQAAVREQLERMRTELVTEQELEKSLNKIEASIVFSEVGVLEKAMNLAYNELVGDANLINTEVERYRAVTPEDIQQMAREIIVPENRNTLHYYAEQ